MNLKTFTSSVPSVFPQYYVIFIASIVAALAWVGHVASESLLPCIAGCHCSVSKQIQNSVTVNCSSAGFSSFSEPFPSNTGEIVLSHNSLGELDLGSFANVPHLQKLVLSYCQLANLTSGKDLSHLLPKLENLDLGNNKLNRIPKNLPRGLQALLLSHNPITVIHYEDSLDSLDNLKELFLDHNQIPVIKTDSFGAALKGVQKLALNHNNIKYIEDESFAKISDLTALTLSHNKLLRIEKDTFKGLTNLKHLDLAYNQINSLGLETFGGLPNLKYLNLNANKLRNFPSNLPMLEWLDISYNEISTIYEDSKPDIYPIEILNLAHNPFHCDCQILWLKQLYERREYLLKHIEVEAKDFIPSCASPQRVARQHWNTLEDEAFTCSSENDGDSSHSRVIKNGDVDLTTRIGVVTDSTIQVMWSSSSPRFSAHNVVIQYYVFGHRTASTKHVEVAATQREHVLKHLRPLTNYVLCMRLRIVTETKQNSDEVPAFSLDDCVEVSTKEPKAPVVASRVEILFYYILGMLATFIGIFATVGGCAIIYGLWTHKNTHWSAKYVNEESYLDGSTYATDEPIKDDRKKQHKD